MSSVRRIGFSLLVFSFVMAPGWIHASEKLSPGIRTLIEGPRYRQSHWGILVVDLPSGETIYEFNPEKLFCPASTTKLFTIASALDAFGADHRFITPIYRRGSVDPDGKLEGDLILVASGDLTLGGRIDKDGRVAFRDVDHTNAGMDDPMAAELTPQDPLAGIRRLARQVADSGIRRVAGDMIVDDRLFETSRQRSGFVRSPIIVNDNLLDFVITPTVPGKAAEVDWRPRTAAYEVDGDVRTVEAAGKPRIEVDSCGPGRIVIRGEMPAGRKPSIRNWHVEDPASFARTLLVEALEWAGVKVEAPALGRNPLCRLPEKGAYAAMTQVTVLKSPPYSETIKLIMKVSQNLGADITPLLLAARHGKRAFEEGIVLERAFLERAGVDVKAISLSDGAGADRGDLVSPRATVQLLRYMSKRPYFKAYHDAQPILGVDGTLAHSVPADSPARGKVHAKTGTILHSDLLNERGILLAKALAGYMTASSGRRLAFAFYVNNILLADPKDFQAVGNDLGKLAEIIYLAQ
jgi:D-alanyl-D-alanine carboxypeptidase/D-alanyl-D-alanine-endopeptidase (penicillin-binding protein 4)